MDLVVLIATSFGRWDQAIRTRAAYARETPGELRCVIEAGRDYGHAWQRAVAQLSATPGLIHFACDRLEPHPGWLKAARADGKRLAAPVLWRKNGSTVDELVADWTPASVSAFPTLTGVQFKRFGLPEPHGLDERSGAEFVVRSNYAFTLLD